MPQVIKDRLEKSKTLWTEIQRLEKSARDMIRVITAPEEFIAGNKTECPETEKRIAGTIRRFAQEQLDEIELALQVVVEDYHRAGIPVQGKTEVAPSEPPRSAEKFKLNEFVEIDPGEGYRLLGPDEIVCKDDEYFDGRNWDHSGRPGVSVRELTGQYPTVARAYRRKVGNEQLSS